MASVDQNPSATSSASQRAADDSDLDPAAFLKSVRELSEKREREDAERYRKLEEDIERGRQERAARRAERAKSISPEKASLSAVSTSTNAATNASAPPMTPPPSTAMDTSASQPASDDIPDFKGFGSGSKAPSHTPSTQSPATMSDASASASKPSPSASSLARSGTLSWQQRPSSRGTSSRPRSMVSSETGTTSKSTPADEPEPSRDQIAASLGSRDPAWFRQTADRGIGNAAYRRSKDDGTSSESFVSGRRGLPGLSQENSREPVKESNPLPPPESVTSDTASRTGSLRDSAISSGRFSADRSSTNSKPDLKALVAEDAEQEKASPMSERTSSVTDGEQSALSRTLTMSSSQARLANATERPSSPTKTAGGFVQSAMMRRSDSQTKRWSAQPGSSVSRQNSASSARAGYGGLTGSHSMPRLEPTPSSREGSSEPASRPTSSSSNLPNLVQTQGRDDKDVFIKPALPSHSRSKSVASNYSTSAEEGHTSPPASPSKRWSPTKSTWLESAITKPESPKPAPAARNSQPSWMADIAKAKAQRASADVTPKPGEDKGLMSTSPTKAMFGQSILKRSESRDLATSRTATPKPVEDQTSRSGSPTKTTRGQDSPKDTQSEDLALPSTKSTAGPSKKDGVPKEPSTIERTRSVPMTSTDKDTSAQPSSVSKAKASEDVKTPAQIQKPDDKPATPIRSPLPSTTAKSKPDTPPKPQTDFRSNLRSRGPSEAKQQEAPEFLSRFGNLRKTQTQNYVAPDVLKGNILRGKSELAKTDGPVKTQRRDELKESLLAKKDQWKKEKEEGVVHERKVSGPPPQTPQKPEALAKRDLLGRSDSTNAPSSPEKAKTATPEALARHRSLKEKPKPDARLPSLEKQASAPTGTSTEPRLTLPKKQTSTPASQANETASRHPTETSNMARFNPGLASVLARGPPPATSGSNASLRPDSPAIPGRSGTTAMSTPSEPPAEGAQLQDMRKGRAKGPKRRKGGAKDTETEVPAEAESISRREAVTAESPPLAEVSAPEPGKADEGADATPKPKPRAPPGSAASVMMASLQKSPVPVQKQAEPKSATPFKSLNSTNSDSKPATPAKSPAHSSTSTPLQNKSGDVASTSQSGKVPDFKGFGSTKRPTPAVRQLEDDKENSGEGSPSVKSTVSIWGKQSPPKKAETPAQIQLPSKKDEEAAMRSAGLLASSPSRPGSRNGLGISTEKGNGSIDPTASSANVPPKPAKPSRSVSGQMLEASPNKGSPGSLEPPQTAVERQLADMFGTRPRSNGQLSIDTPAVVANSPHQERTLRTIRKSVQASSQDGSSRQLPPKEEYTFFDESVYTCHHSYNIADGPKKTEIFLWVGNSSSGSTLDQAQNGAKKIAKEAGNAFVHTVRQGFEPPGFLQALGGILVTRRGCWEHAPKQYMLCGRKHLGQIVFDEVDFGVDSLCSGFVYLISYPVTLQETRLYLWKGSACSTEEISAARLAAMDLSETGEIIEVDDGAEFPSFLKIFGPGTTKVSIPKAPELWQQKALAPSQFATRLFRIQLAEARTGLFSSMFRRPSWSGRSPARQQDDEAKAEAKEISPFTQSDLEADCIYLLDAYSELHVLIGPMFASQPETVRNALMGQTVLFASEYGVLAASTEDRPVVPKAFVLLSGVPRGMKMVFRHWDDSTGLWGTGGLMAGSQANRNSQVELLDLNEALGVVRKG